MVTLRLDLVAADVLAATSASLEIADVIWSARVEPLSWLFETLERHPGCAVAASQGPGGAYVAARRAGRLYLSSFIHNDIGTSSLGTAFGSEVFGYAVFVYACLASSGGGVARRVEVGEPAPDIGDLGRVDAGIDVKRAGEVLACPVQPVLPHHDIGEHAEYAGLLITSAEAHHELECFLEGDRRGIGLAGFEVSLPQAGQAPGLVVRVRECGSHAPGLQQVLYRLLVPPGIAMRFADVPGHAHDAAGNADLGEDVPGLDEPAGRVVRPVLTQVNKA